MISELLVLQGAQKEGLSASSEEVEQEYQDIAAQVGGEEALKSQLAVVEVDEPTLRENLRRQIVAEKYMDAHIQEAELAVSREEIEAYYTQASQGQENTPLLSQVEEQIRGQLKSQKSGERITEIVLELRENADVEKLL